MQHQQFKPIRCVNLLVCCVVIFILLLKDGRHLVIAGKMVKLGSWIHSTAAHSNKPSLTYNDAAGEPPIGAAPLNVSRDFLHPLTRQWIMDRTLSR